MNKNIFLNLITATLLIFIFFFAADAQQTDSGYQDADDVSARPNLLRELDLSANQIRQIRRLNQERRAIMQQAQRRLREANQSLDRAVYADGEDDAEIQSRLREVQTAHQELVKQRTITEREIRRVLTGAQLAKFRALRGRFKQNENTAGESKNNRIINRQNNLRNLPKNLRLNRRNNRPLRRQIQ